ncbi:hypothetical protein [Cohnella hashimotonis]|uniref:Uncharacterized protein n=1 Tax=Cohnella hashimotonis TaxID=2826895 RepID=A0ABT6TNB6_9BACL|nr:hypothetical protein [Cohnella hashimotonis]MDI4647409.1 hypothetical protein [Cohnella hashimotonis]
MYPSGVATDQFGNYHLISGDKHQKFDSNDNLIWSIPRTSTGAITRAKCDHLGNIYANYEGLKKISPTGTIEWNVTRRISNYLAVDSLGNVITITRNVSGYVTKYDANGTMIWEKSVFSPYWIDVDRSNNIFYTATSSSLSPKSLIKYDTNGNEIWANSNNIDQAAHLAVDNYNNVYFGDTGFGTFQKISNNNTLIYSLYYPISPSRFKTDINNNLYIYGISGIAKINNNNGQIIWLTRTEGTISNIAIDSNENVFVITSNNINLYKYDPNGNKLWSTGYKESSIAIDSENNIYSTSASSTLWTLIKYSNSDGSTIFLNSYFGEIESTYMGSIVIDSNDNIYIYGKKPSTNRPFLAKMNKNGQVLKEVDLSNVDSFLTVQLLSIKFDSFTNTIILNTRNWSTLSNRLYKFNTDLDSVWSKSLTVTPNIIDTDKNGNIYLMQSNINPYIFQTRDINGNVIFTPNALTSATNVLFSSSYAYVSSNQLKSFIKYNLTDLPRPSNFEWDIPKVQGENIHVTKAEWDKFISRIDAFREYLEMINTSTSAITVGERLKANTYRQAVWALRDMGYGWSLELVVGTSEVSNLQNATSIKASHFNQLRDELNSIP